MHRPRSDSPLPSFVPLCTAAFSFFVSSYYILLPFCPFSLNRHLPFIRTVRCIYKPQKRFHTEKQQPWAHSPVFTLYYMNVLLNALKCPWMSTAVLKSQRFFCPTPVKGSLHRKHTAWRECTQHRLCREDNGTVGTPWAVYNPSSACKPRKLSASHSAKIWR